MRNGARFLLGLFFIVAGMGHFLWPGLLLRMVPPGLPEPTLIVLVSGVIEMALGMAALTPGVPLVFTRWSLITLLVAVFPANIYMAMHPELFPEFTPMGILLRLPVQGLFILWVWYATGESPPLKTGSQAVEAGSA